MNKNDIKSAISIEYGLSIEQSAKVVDNIFKNILDCLGKSKNIEIQKFGSFTINNEKNREDKRYGILKFTPSKKLSVRVNSNFENLKKVKIKEELKDHAGIQKRISGKKAGITGKNSEDKIKRIEGNKLENKEPVLQRKLISEDLIKLHKEIVMGEVSGKDNLWG